MATIISFPIDRVQKKNVFVIRFAQRASTDDLVKKVVHVQRCQCAGHIETEVHQALAEFSYASTYYKNGGYIECRELFKCDPEHAILLLKKLPPAKLTKSESPSVKASNSIEYDKKYLEHEERDELCRLLPIVHTPSKWMTVERWRTLTARRRAELRLLVSDEFPEFENAYKWLLTLGSGK